MPAKAEPSASPLERLVNDRHPSCPVAVGFSLAGCSVSLNAANPEQAEAAAEYLVDIVRAFNKVPIWDTNQ